MIKVLFIDFYSTIVHEDGEVINRISLIISETGDGTKTAEICRFWWNEFQASFLFAHGESFVTISGK